jgi:hypothetical protein
VKVVVTVPYLTLPDSVASNQTLGCMHTLLRSRVHTQIWSDDVYKAEMALRGKKSKTVKKEKERPDDEVAAEDRKIPDAFKWAKYLYN